MFIQNNGDKPTFADEPTFMGEPRKKIVTTFFRPNPLAKQNCFTYQTQRISENKIPLKNKKS